MFQLNLPKISSDIPVGCFSQVLRRLLTSKVFLSVPSTLALSILECMPFSSSQYRRLKEKQNRRGKLIRNPKQKVIGVDRPKRSKMKENIHTKAPSHPQSLPHEQ